MKQDEFWIKARKVLINKYAITLYVFAVLFIFVGEQSLINQISRAREIREIESEIKQEKQKAADAQLMLQSLDNLDTLERFAREQYNMHADGEVVYIVE